MKLKSFMAALLAAVAFIVAPAISHAQEGEPIVVDEVIAQVNEGVITLSMLKREMRERIEELKQNGMTEQQATENVNKNQAQMIVTLINGQILLQKGKELDLSDEVEAAVNRRMLEIAKTQNITSMEKLEEAMKASGIDPATIRATMRTEMTKQAVVEREVDAKIYYGPTIDDLKKYFEAHKDQFRKPESVKLSEIFLSLAGKPEAEVKARAEQIVKQARGGADFGTLATTYSERESGGVRVAVQTKGDVGLFEVPALRPDLGAAIKTLKSGGISDPLRSDEGYQILRVDVRNAGSEVPTFNEARVREAITAERIPKEREAYIQNLRNDAYIKLAESYQASVMPLLKLTPPKTVRAADEKKEKDKNGKP